MLKAQISSYKNLVDFSVIKNFFIYFLGALAQRGVAILLTPLTLSILTPHDYGLLALANNFISILTVLIGLGLRQAFSLEFFGKSRIEQKTMINDMMIIYFLIAVPIFIVLLSHLSAVNYFIFVSQAQTTLLLISLGISFIYFFIEFFYQLLQYTHKAVLLSSLQVSSALLTTLLSLIFLIYFRLGILSILSAQMISMLLMCLIGLYMYIKKQCSEHIYPQQAAYKFSWYLQRSLPFMPTVFFGWILASSDRWVLAHYADLADVGIYSLANTFCNLFQVFVLYPLAGAYLPHIFDMYHKNKTDAVHIANVERNNKITMLVCMIGVTILIVVGYITCKPILFWLLPPVYHQATNYILLLLLGQVFFMGTYFSNCLIQFYKKTYFLGFALCIPALLNVILNIALVPYFAIYGCVVATLISYILYFIISMWYNLIIIQQITTKKKDDFHEQKATSG